jgi:uncharacterized membrane protein YcaP (DUF421 family)
MLHDLFHMGIPVGEKVIRTIGVYVALLVLLRIGGKRDLAQLNSFDLVVMLLLSNVVQNAIIGNDNSLLGGVIGAAVLIAINSVVVRATRATPMIERIVDGTSTTLVRDGQFDDTALHKEGLRRADVEAALRRQNANEVDEVARLTLDPGGALIVELRPDEQNATKGDLAALEQRLTALLRPS